MELNIEEARACYIALNALQEVGSVALRTKLIEFLKKDTIKEATKDEPKRRNRNEPVELESTSEE
jgi:hypothetical protein